MKLHTQSTLAYDGPAIVSLLVALILTGCGPLATPTPAPPPTRGSPPATIGLPAEWTPTDTSTPRPTDTPTPTLLPSETPSPRPTGTPTATQPTSTPIPTPDLSDPYAVVEAAFAAHLRGDEETLAALYDDFGDLLCKDFFGSYSHCISLPYRLQGLKQIEQWWLQDRPSDDDPLLGLIVLYSRWAGSDKEWQQLFTVYDYDGQWLIHEHSTEVYPSEP